MTTEQVHRLAGVVAATGLPGADFGPSDEVLDADAMAGLLDLVTAERIPGHLVAALDCGAIRATPEQRAEACRRHEEAMALDLVLERLLTDTSSVLAAAGIVHRALKGPVVARTLYAEPTLRSFGDVDLLVAADQFDAAVNLVVARGGRRRYREPRYSTLRDIAEFLYTTSVDVDRVLSLATGWHGRAVVQRALHLTGSRLPIEVPQPLREWAEAYRPDRFERAALAVYVSPDASYAARAATGVWALRGLRRKLAYASALLVPRRSYLRERDVTYLQRWRRARELHRRWRQAR